MKRFACTCGNHLFFDNTICLNCKSEVGFCPECQAVSQLLPGKTNGFTCGRCKTALLKCDNYYSFNVCNRCVRAESAGNPAICDYCRFNVTVPDLNVAGNKAKWASIEAAKRRVMYDFDRLGIVYGNADDGIVPALRFEFKGDTIRPASRYRNIQGGEQVFTGHDNGTVTINIREADAVEREKARIAFAEAHRTLVGHFRHEMGHYVWDVSVKGQREEECIALFGDHTANYDESLKAYYANGPKLGWQEAYVSGYATMHPWEDFAETFANYLDMMSTIETAQEGKLIPRIDVSDLEGQAHAYVNVGVTLNEMNRTIGLIDFLPEVIVAPVRKKMAFIHSLTKVGQSAQPAEATA